MTKTPVTIEKRQRLLQTGFCPIHACPLIEVCQNPEGAVGFRCSLRCCRIAAVVTQGNSQIRLTPDFIALLELDSPDPVIESGVAGIASIKSDVKRNLIMAKTHGACFYCGVRMSLDETTIDHFTPLDRGGSNRIENLVPACLRCNCTKGPRTIEEFRFTHRMRMFKKRTGISFTFAQHRYLRSKGFKIGMEMHLFWFEIHGLKPPSNVIPPSSNRRKAGHEKGDANGNAN